MLKGNWSGEVYRCKIKKDEPAALRKKNQRGGEGSEKKEWKGHWWKI